MAEGDKIRLRQGTKADLPSSLTPGQLLFATYEDEVRTSSNATESLTQGDIYFDKDSTHRIKLANDVDKARTLFAGQTLSTTMSGRWTANIEGVDKLYDGLTISLNLSTLPTSPYNTLNINNLGNKLVWFKYNQPLVDQINAKSEVLLTYRTDAGAYIVPTTGNSGTLTSGATIKEGWVITSGSSGNQGNIYYVRGTQTAATGSWTGNLKSVNALYEGLTIAYYLPVAGSGSATLTLNLTNSTTAAIPVYWTGTSRATTHYGVGSVIILTYVDNAWRRADYDSNSNTVPSAYCDTAAGTANKGASCTAFSLKPQSYLHFDIRYSNTAQNALTMNINSTGAKDIYINGEPSSASNYTLPAGSYIAYYDGVQWQFRTDGILPGKFSADFITDGTLDVVYGGTGVTSLPNGALLQGNGPAAISKASAAGNVSLPIYIDSNGKAQTITSYSGNAASANKLATARTIALSGAAIGTATSFDGSANITIPVTTIKVSGTGVNVEGTLPIAHGGTGATSFTSGAILQGNGGNAISVAATKGSVSLPIYIDSSGKPQTITSYEGTSAAANKLATARTIALSGAATGTATSFDGTANIIIPVTGLKLSGTGVSIEGTLPVAHGGTGATTFTSGALLQGNSGNAIKAAASAGSASLPIYIDTSGKPQTITSYQGNAASATKLETARTISITGAVTGTATSFNGTANISIPTTGIKVSGSGVTVEGTLPIAHGGTGVTTFANNQVLIGSGGNPIKTDANLIFDTTNDELQTKHLSLTGDLTVTGDAYLNNNTYADGLNANTLLVTGNANFAVSPTAPTPESGDSSTKLATTEFVKTTSISVSNLSGVLPVAKGGTGHSAAFTAGRVIYSKSATEMADSSIAITGTGTQMTITGASSARGEYVAKRGSYTMFMGFGSGNENHGLYSLQKNDWMIYSDKNGNVQVNGNAATASTATKLTNGRTLLVNLASSSASSAFNGTANVHNIGVSGTLPIAFGGTGATLASGARTNLGLGNAKLYYGTCATAAGTTTKEVVCAEFPSTLSVGLAILVKFDNQNSGAVGSLQLKVGSTDAKPIKYEYNGTASNLPGAGYLRASTYLFVYDGTNWNVQSINYNTNTTTTVRQQLSTADTNYPLILSSANNTNTNTNVDDLTYRNNAIYANPSTGYIRANLNAADIKSGTVSVAVGGTGATSFTSGALLQGNGGSAISAATTRGSATLPIYIDGSGKPQTITSYQGASRYLQVPDTRNAAIDPSTLNATTGVRYDFKAKATVGLSDGTYAAVMSLRPYASASDWSGGPAHQIAYNSTGAILHRISTGDTTWGAWETILTTNSDLPVGKITGILPVAKGGTGNSTFTANRMVYAESATKLSSAASIYATASALAVNKTSITSGYNFEVSGKSLLGGDVLVNGTTDSTAIDNGSLVVKGGASIAKQLRVADDITLYAQAEHDRAIVFGYGSDTRTDTMPPNSTTKNTNVNSGASWRLIYLASGSSDTNYFAIQSSTSSTGVRDWNNVIRLGMNTFDAHFGGDVNPLTTNANTLGTSSLEWKHLYVKGITASSNVGIGGTLTVLGQTTLQANKYDDTKNTGALNLLNSDIFGVNSIKFADRCDSAGEGLQWFRDDTHVDSLWVKDGDILFTPNRTWGGSATTYKVLTSQNVSWAAWTAGDASNGPKANLSIGGTTITSAAIPAATGTVSGVLTATTQTIGGSKTFSSAATFNSSVGIGGTLTVAGASTMNGTFTAANTSAFKNTATFEKEIKVIGRQWVHSATGTSTQGYLKIANLVITDSYTNQPTTIEFSRRSDGANTIISITFQNLNGTDPNLVSFKVQGPCQDVFMNKIAAGSWDLYVKETEGYDTVVIHRYHKGSGNITLTWISEEITEAISGWTQATHTLGVSWTAGTTAGPTVNVTALGKTDSAVIPSASASASGIVTTGAQTFAGAKTFNSNVSVGGTFAVAGATTLNGTLTASKVSSFTNATDATSTATGAVKISGGVGIAKSLYVGTRLYSPAVGSEKFIAYPNDGYYTYNGGNITGAIKITLPQSWTATMITMAVSIYNYANNSNIEYYISGYNYTGGDGYWTNTGAYTTGKSSLANLPVRFGHDGSKCCIIIGDVTTSWSYPKVQVHDVVFGYSNSTFNQWATGWSVSVITTLPENIDSTHSETNILNPSENNTGSIGTATRVWKDIYATNLHITTLSAAGGISTPSTLTVGGLSTLQGGLHVYGSVDGGAWSGGGYHKAHNSIVLHGDGSGVSGILFKSSTGTGDTAINHPSDRAFIQYHAKGITTATAENADPTLATSGELGRLVIGIGNDTTDQIWLQAPDANGLKHQIGATSYTIATSHSSNTYWSDWTAGTTAGPQANIYIGAVKKTSAAIPSASASNSGVVTTGSQTFAGAKSFSGLITAVAGIVSNGPNDSIHSKDTAASVVFKGGVSVEKNLSVKSLRIDNNQTTKGVSLQYDETLETLNFIFAS